MDILVNEEMSMLCSVAVKNTFCPFLIIIVITFVDTMEKELFRGKQLPLEGNVCC